MARMLTSALLLLALAGCGEVPPGRSDAELGFMLGLDGRPGLPAAPEDKAEQVVRDLFADGTIRSLTLTRRDWGWAQSTFGLSAARLVPADGTWEAVVTGDLRPKLDGLLPEQLRASQCTLVLVGPDALIAGGKVKN
jgi:hypothetical protein